MCFDYSLASQYPFPSKEQTTFALQTLLALMPLGKKLTEPFKDVACTHPISWDIKQWR